MQSKEYLTTISKYISMLLRHKPESGNLILDEHGWVETEKLIEAVSLQHPLDKETLEEIVSSDSKSRYEFSDDHSMIRARHGHSVPVVLDIDPTIPPDVLYHGTSEDVKNIILSDGLKPMVRRYVHLSSDPDTARSVGKRHGRAVVLEIDAGRLSKKGEKFYQTAGGIWLVASVPPEFICEFDK